MSVLQGIKVYYLTLLKISYEIFIILIVVAIVMAIIRFIKGDKAYFSKKLDKLIRW